jgi:hypothetical protein
MEHNMNFKSLFTITLLSAVLASPPSESYCKQARTAYTIAGAQCAIAAAISGPFATACGVGVGVYTISIEIACGVAGHFVGPELPPIATKLKNGTIVDLPGDHIHDVVEAPEPVQSLRKRGIALCGAGLDCLDVNHELFTKLGLAANSTETCETVGKQVCVPGNRGFMTCNSDNKWSVMQACGHGTTCESHPESADRILCNW